VHGVRREKERAEERGAPAEVRAQEIKNQRRVKAVQDKVGEVVKERRVAGDQIIQGGQKRSGVMPEQHLVLTDQGVIDDCGGVVGNKTRKEGLCVDSDAAGGKEEPVARIGFHVR
jgi:hypothetical protein